MCYLLWTARATAAGFAVAVGWMGSSPASAGPVPVANEDPPADFSAHVPPTTDGEPDDLLARLSELRHASLSVSADLDAKSVLDREDPWAGHVLIPLPAGAWTGLVGLGAGAMVVAWASRSSGRRAGR
jgi:hypothetical protein